RDERIRVGDLVRVRRMDWIGRPIIDGVDALLEAGGCAEEHQVAPPHSWAAGQLTEMAATVRHDRVAADRHRRRNRKGTGSQDLFGDVTVNVSAVAQLAGMVITHRPEAAV